MLSFGTLCFIIQQYHKIRLKELPYLKLDILLEFIKLGRIRYLQFSLCKLPFTMTDVQSDKKVSMDKK